MYNFNSNNSKIKFNNKMNSLILYNKIIKYNNNYPIIKYIMILKIVK